MFLIEYVLLGLYPKNFQEKLLKIFRMKSGPICYNGSQMFYLHLGF